MRRIKFLILIILAIFITTTGFGCRWNPFRADKELFQPVTLEYWGVWDTPAQLQTLIETYQASHPTIKISYRNLRFEEYEKKLLEAFADDRGPDIFAIPATWLLEYQHRLEPMPATHKVPVQTLQGSIKKQLVTNLVEFNGLSTNDINIKYVPVVYEDVVLDKKIYGLPYSLDTLVTFYNSNLLEQAAIPEPIGDFHDLVEQAPKLSKASESNRILQSAVALGGTKNVPRFFDIFSSIMLQNGVNAKGNNFNPMGSEDSAERLEQVFSFYTDFARPGRATYSWNEDLDNAFEMFVSGKLAYFFGYSYHADELRRRSIPFRWEITNFPQTRGAEGTKYYTDYWVNVVSKKSKNKDAAWNFIQTTADQNVVEKYLKANKKPTALRGLIESQLQNVELKVFASQVLTADNWYQGYNVILAEEYLQDAIDSALAGTDINFINLFIQRVNQTYQPPQL